MPKKSNERLISDYINRNVIPKLKSKGFIDRLVILFNDTDLNIAEYKLGIPRPKGFKKGE